MTGQLTWSELVSQPKAWRQLIERLDRGDGMPQVSLDAFDEVVMLGSGTSYYLALAAADWVRRRHPIDVRAVPSCEVMLDEHERRAAGGRKRLAIAISRSGESSEVVLAATALQAAGATVLGVSCVAGSSLLELADRTFLIGEGAEDGLVMLRSFTSMLIALQYLFGADDDRGTLRTLPDAGTHALENHERLRALANTRAFDRFVFLGSTASYPIALEASLKVQEMSICTSEAYHTLEYRHGPKATADGDTLVTLLTPPDNALGTSLARDLKALGATLLVVGTHADDYRDVADLAIAPSAALGEGCVSPINLVALQLLAYETAMRRGGDPDAPVNLSKVVIL